MDRYVEAGDSLNVDAGGDLARRDAFFQTGSQVLDRLGAQLDQLAADRLARLGCMHLAIEGPSYPFDQNTSMARLSTASLSKLRGRPRSAITHLIFVISDK